MRLFDQEFLDEDILGPKEQDAFPRSVVPPGAAGFLIICFHIFGKIIMDYIADVGFIDTHAEGVGCHHNPDFIVKKQILTFRSFSVTESGVVPARRKTLLAQRLIDMVNFFAGCRVNDPGLVLPGGQVGKQKIPFIFTPQYGKGQVFPVKPSYNTLWVLQTQHIYNILPHLGCGCGCKGSHHRPAGHLPDKGSDGTVTGPEIMAPLGDTVGLVHCQHRNWHSANAV
ncbi:MAG: hypothetical protein BWY80_00368 [Firmicutes bacterium ADurb.Bin456]|nr:MAG: hypothetical protein BWY80_00368 [Firmicutes bacterium ADurb.Bin456]